MGFYIRKSSRLGPFRLNVSKSGLGASVGVRGARVSSGPRGTYINLGRHGVYYRQRIDVPSGRGRAPAAEPTTSPGDGPTRSTESAQAEQFVDSTSEKLIEDLNTCAQRIRFAPLLFIFAVLATYFAFQFSELLAIPVATAGLIVMVYQHHRDQIRRTLSVFYELDQTATTRFASVTAAVEALAKSERVWAVRSASDTWDWKRNAGANVLINRDRADVAPALPPNLATNATVWSIGTRRYKLFFLPDRVLLYEGARYGAISYATLSIGTSTSHFRETDPVPSDARIVGHTWQYVRKDGGPDRRFGNNRQIPIAQYAYIELTTPNGFKSTLQASNVEAALTFARTLSNDQPSARAANHDPRDDSRSRKERDPAPPPSAASSVTAAHEVLGLTVGASPEEITAAYRRMVQMYHPDKVATLGPEFREIAERRMKEINAAYGHISKR